MKGFKNSTKTVSGHHGWNGTDCPGFATGGIVTPFKTPGRSGPAAMRPSMPRPHVMPNLQKVSMPRTKLARGGKVMQGSADGGGGPYNGNPEGNSLEKSNRPYAEVEVEHPRNDARPGYARGGKKGPSIKKGALHKDMGIPQGKKIPVGAIRSKLARDKASGNSKGVKRDVFAINAKTKFADGGHVNNLAFGRQPLFGNKD